MNEETIIEKRPNTTGPSETKKEGGSWRHVTVGGISGILLGAGLVYAGGAHAAGNGPQQETEEEKENANTQSEAEGLKVAASHEDLSFGEAFAAARAEVGPGGVFHWHGGVYGTYYADEWNAMTAEQKNDFAQQALPEVRTAEASRHEESHPDVAVHSETTAEPQPVSNEDDVQLVEHQIAENFDMGEDVHIVGYADVEGYLAVGYDITGDGVADVAIIDMDYDHAPSDADVIMDRAGNMARLGDLNSEPDPNHMAAMENPDVAPGMPDYMNDANVDDMNIEA